MTRSRGTIRLSRLLSSTSASYDSDTIDIFRVIRHSKSIIRIKRHRKGNKHRDRVWGEARIHELSDKHFTRMFRLNRVAFNDLLLKISHLLPGQDLDEAIRSSGSPISNYCRLAMTLRWLAGGHYLDICQLYQVDYSTFYSEDGIIWPTIPYFRRQ